jgi:hypothetical protein
MGTASIIEQWIAMIAVVRTSETSVFFNATARLYIWEDCYLDTRNNPYGCEAL